MEEWILEREFVLWLGTQGDKLTAPDADQANRTAASDAQRAPRSRRRESEVGEELIELR